MKKLFTRTCLLASLTAIPPLYAQEPTVANPGFENDHALRGWTTPPNVRKGNVSRSDEFVRTGSWSLKLDRTIPSEPGDGSVMLFQTIHGIKPNTIYYLTAWAKGGEAAHGSVRAAIKLEYYNADGKNTSGVNAYHNLMANGEWDRIQAVGKSDPDTVSVKIYARNFERNVVYFDDFELSQPAILATEPSRIIHEYGKEVPVRVRVVMLEPLDASNSSTVKLIAEHDGKSATYDVEAREIGENMYELSATLPPITSGSYRLTPVMGEDQSPTVVRTFEGMYDRKPAGLSDTGTILKDGKPFFPIGIYHPQNYAYYQIGGKSNGPETVGEDYDKIAEAGFNVVQGDSTENIENFGRYLDEAHQRGLLVDVPFYAGGRIKKNFRSSLAKIERFKDHPAVLNWKISDEPDMRPAVADEVPEAYLTYRRASPNIPVEVTLATDNALDNWGNFADIIQINRYPLPGGELTRVSDYTRKAMEAKLPWQNVSYVVQSGWTKEGTVPTKDELRSMIYLALIEGAKGIWYYTMYDPRFDLTQTSIWPHMKSINEEVKALSLPVMLGEHEQAVSVDNPVIYQRALAHDGQLIILLTNPERTAQSTTLNLPAQWANAPVKTLDGQEVTKGKGGSIALKFAPTDSRTLVVGTPKSAE